MKRSRSYFAFGWTLLICLSIIAASMAVSHSALAFRAAAERGIALQIQEEHTRAHALPAAGQGFERGIPLEGGTRIEWRGGGTACRQATAEEVREMRREPAMPLHVISEESFAPEPQGKGLKIILRGTAQLEKHPEAKAAFLRAARTWESLVQNPITVVIDVDFGTHAFGEPFVENQAGATKFQRNFDENAYAGMRSALIASAGSPMEADLYNALPATQLPTDLGPTTGLIYHVAPKRALGLLSPVADPDAELQTLGPPPTISFNSAYGYDFDPSDGIQRKRSDFTALALHEIGHVLGFFSGVGVQEQYPDAPPQTPDVLDIFRFRPGITLAAFSTAQRILSSGGEQLFFAGGVELPFSTGRFDYTGGDLSQAGHWKEDDLSGRYIGIMDPTFSYATRYEITNNDLEAFDRIGYRMNPLPDPRVPELSVDDGRLETRVWEDGVMLVNRLTPPSYPAKLEKLRILIPPLSNQPNPVGKPITLMIGTTDNTNGLVPHLTRVESFVPSTSPDLFLEFPIPNGPTIQAGDFYVGYQAPAPMQGVGFAVDTSSASSNRTFFSEDGGASFALLSAALQGRPANAMIRALVSVGGPAPTPTPTPKPTPGPELVNLTSGVSVDGYMATYSVEGIYSETQYTIEVPNGATQLQINLTANTDLDLYARHGSRITVQNGNFIADAVSDTKEDPESITLTATSSPPLRAGRYYMMIVNYGPGPSTYKITATVSSKSVVSVSAASFQAEALAAEQIAAAFGSGLATGMQVAADSDPNRPGIQLPTTLLGTTVRVTDRAGTQRMAPLFFVSPTQINYQVPAGTAAGAATVTVTSGDGTVFNGTASIVGVMPGIFTANGDGQGVPAALALRVSGGTQRFEPVIEYDAAQHRFVPLPLDLGRDIDEVFLIMFGTGWRNRQSLSSVRVTVGGIDVPIFFAGAQADLTGLDQINLRLPRTLIGRGDVDVALTIDGRAAAPVRIRIR